MEQAEDAEKDARADLTAAEEQLKIIGVGKAHRPIEQCLRTHLGGYHRAKHDRRGGGGRTPIGISTAFTIADLPPYGLSAMSMKTTCPRLRLGQQAQIQSTLIPASVIGRVSDIGPVLDPTIRTAKSALKFPTPACSAWGCSSPRPPESQYEVSLGRGTGQRHSASARSRWVFVPAARKIQAGGSECGDMLPGNRQEIFSGIEPGQQVVQDVLQLQATVEAQ